MPSTASAEKHQAQLRKAMDQHAAGHLDQARARYLSVLKAEPWHPDALHLMGVLEAQLTNYDDAADLIGRAIAVQPAEAMFHNNLGNVLLEADRLDEAEASYRRAHELDARRPDVLNNLAVLVARRGEAALAEAMLKEAITIAPEFVGARENLANQYKRAGRMEEALEVCVQTLMLKPGNPRLRVMMGSVCVAMGRNDQAAAMFRQWLETEPDNPEARYLLQACTGEAVPERAPDDYVARTFDTFAGSFDAKLAALSYRAPELVGEVIARHAGAPARQHRVLDAGCGTGLSGVPLKPFAKRLVGVDLSAGMLQRARPRKLYDALHKAELVSFIAARPGAFDIIVSADTLCYFGALDAFAAAARAALSAGGLLAFTVESHADEEGAAGWRLQGHGRYSHGRAYLEAVLRGTGFEVLELQAVVLRQEVKKPVHGWLVAARAAGG